MSFASPQHALYAGWACGVAWKAGLPLLPDQDENGDYLPSMTLQLGDGVTLTFVVPEPPAGWILPS